MECKFGFYIVFLIPFYDMIFYAILILFWYYYFCSCGFDEFSLIWYTDKFDVMILIR